MKTPRLGQHFLDSPAIAEKIAREARVASDDIVLEIGPGTGVLTRVLLNTKAQIIAVEKDEGLAEALQKNCAEEITNGQLRLVVDDVRSVSPYALELGAGNYKVVANIPYYITGEIIRQFLSDQEYPSLMALLVQKEVAERIARDHKESILSLSVKAYGTPRYAAMVRRGSFRPAPAVDSAILVIEHISKNAFSEHDVEEDMFFFAVKQGFSQKRKRLFTNLANVFSKNIVQKAFTELGLDENIRAEDLPLEVWFKLTHLLGPYPHK